jgi:DNA-binding GntR family transcriptional regulator
MTAPTETDEDHVPSPRASAGAVDVIREWIFDGSLESGARLKEEELAREIGISRTPIREALFVLQAEGLVELIPNRGAVVRGYDLSDLEKATPPAVLQSA